MDTIHLFKTTYKSTQTMQKYKMKKKKLEKELLPINMKELKKWLIENYGNKCKDYSDCCPICHAWKVYKMLKKILEY